MPKTKQRVKEKNEFRRAKEFAIVKEKLPIVSKLEKMGFKIDEVNCEYDEEGEYMAFLYLPSLKNLTFRVGINDEGINYYVYDCATENYDENEILIYENGKLEYLGFKLEDRKAIKAVVDFGKVCGFKVDKNEIMA